MTSRRILEQVRAVLHDRDDVVAARVFGSVARGAESPNDVDLAVLLDTPDGAAARCAAIADAVEHALGLPVDCHDFEQLPLAIRFRVLREGELVVDRDPARRHRGLPRRRRAVSRRHRAADVPRRAGRAVPTDASTLRGSGRPCTSDSATSVPSWRLRLGTSRRASSERPPVS